jgi:hypothetical protein
MPRKIRRIGRETPPRPAPAPEPPRGNYKRNSNTGHSCNYCIYREHHVYNKWSPDFPERAWCPVANTTYVTDSSRDQVTVCGTFRAGDHVVVAVEPTIDTLLEMVGATSQEEARRRGRHTIAGTVTGRASSTRGLTDFPLEVMPEDSICRTCRHRDHIRARLRRSEAGTDVRSWACNHALRQRIYGAGVRTCQSWEQD